MILNYSHFISAGYRGQLSNQFERDLSQILTFIKENRFAIQQSEGDNIRLNTTFI